MKTKIITEIEQSMLKHLADCPKTKKILVKRQRMWYN